MRAGNVNRNDARAGGRDLREGFGIIEAVVSLVILGIILAAILPAFVNNMRINTDGEIRTNAVAVGQQTMDDLRGRETWLASGTQQVVEMGGSLYTATLVHDRYCEGEDCFDGARQVSVEVRHNGRVLYRVETVFTALDATGL